MSVLPTVTFVTIEPDWEMLFLGDECLLEGHSIEVGEALKEMSKYNYDHIETRNYNGYSDDVMPSDVKEKMEIEYNE